MKIVINAEHGGFSLSNWAIEEYARRKGIVLYVHEPRDFGSKALKSLTGLNDYWTVPEDQRPLAPYPWHEAPIEDRAAYNDAYEKLNFSCRDPERDDPDLVAVVEADSEKASGGYAKLKVVEIPDGVEWEIEEYDGLEWVSEKHRRWD